MQVPKPKRTAAPRLDSSGAEKTQNAPARFELGARLAHIVARIGGKTKAGRIIGVGDQTIRSWIIGTSKMPLESAVKLAEAARANLEWLAYGRGPEALPEGFHDKPALFIHSHVNREGYVYVPRYDVAGLSGLGSLSESHQILDYMALREDFVRLTLRADPAKLVLNLAIGDSMEPAIRTGDLLLIDTAVNRFVDDAIYVLVKKGELTIKRVQRFFNGAVSLKSDNTAAYAAETLNPHEAAEIRVLGRVRWIGRLV